VRWTPTWVTLSMTRPGVTAATGATAGGPRRSRRRLAVPPLDAVYPVVFIDAVRVEIRDGYVVNRSKSSQA